MGRGISTSGDHFLLIHVLCLQPAAPIAPIDRDSRLVRTILGLGVWGC